MAWTPPTTPEDSYELSPFGFGPFPLPGQSVSVAPPHPEGGGFGGVGFFGSDAQAGDPYGLGGYGSMSFGRPRINISGGYGGDPYGLGTYGGVDPDPPMVSSAISLNGFEIEVYFSEEVDTTNPALTDPASYALIPVTGAAPATVLSVHIEKLGSVNLSAGDTIAGAISVVLTHSGTTLGGTYRVVATGLTDLSGNVIIDASVTFLTRGSPPACVASLPGPDPGNEVLLTFNQDMLRAVDEPGAGPGIEDAASYVFESQTAYPIQPEVLSAVHDAANSRRVTLAVQGMTSLVYDITVGPALAFSYDPVGGLQDAVRVDTGTGTAVVSTTNLVVGRLKNNAFGLEWQDQSGSIVPLISTLRMDCRYDFSNAAYNPAINTFALPEVVEVLFQDGVLGNGILVRFTLQYGLGAAEQIRVRSGVFDATVAATWTGGPHTLSLVRNMKAGTVTFLLDDFPLTTTAIVNVTGVCETQAGIRFTLLNGGWDLTGVRLQQVLTTSSQTVYSQAWNFLHENQIILLGSGALARDWLMTQRGPLVKSWGDTTPATKQDVTVTVNGTEVEVSDINPYIGKVWLTIPVPLLPPGPGAPVVNVDYQWFKNPVMEMAGLNTEGLVLNKFDCRRNRHSTTITPSLGAADTQRFPMGVVLGPVTRRQPLLIGHRYMGFERAYSALTNSPTTLVLNQVPGRASVPGLSHTVQGVSAAFEGVVKPTAATPAWALSGVDYGWVNHQAETGLDLGTYTVIDAQTGSFETTSTKAVVYHRGVDLSAPASVYLVARFQVGTGSLFETTHPSPGGVATVTASNGVFTGVGFGIHDNLRLYFCGALQINGLEHVGLLLNPKRPHEAASWSVGPKATMTANSQTRGILTTSQVPVGFVATSRFQVLTGPQVGTYTATSVVHQTNGTTTIEFTPALPEPWDRWGNKYPEVVFETRLTLKPFTFRMDIDTEQQVAELRVSGEVQGVVARIDGDVPALAGPANTSMLIPQGAVGQAFWGSLDRQAASRSVWSFMRYGSVPDQVFLQGHSVTVNTEMATLPERESSPWFLSQGFGSSEVSLGEMLVKTGVGHPTLDFSYSYARVEPFFSPEATMDYRARWVLETGTLGAGDVEMLLDNTQRTARVVPLLYQEGFPGDDTFRRLINLPSASTTGFCLPEVLGWSPLVGSTLSPVVEGAQLVVSQSSTARGGWTKDLDWTIPNAVSTDEGRLFEARFAVTSFTANVAGDTGIRFGCQMPGVVVDAVVQVELRAEVTPGIRLRTAVGAPVQEYDFDWTAGGTHTYRILADNNAATVSVLVDGVLLAPVAPLNAFSGGVTSVQAFFGCYGVNAANVVDATITCTVEWHHFHAHVLAPQTAKRTLGVWLGGDEDDINSFEVPRTDTVSVPNSWSVGPVLREMDWRNAVEVRVFFDPGWGVTVLRPDLPAPPYYQAEDGTPGSGFITESTEPSAGWINVEYANLPRSSNTLGMVGFGSRDTRSISQSRWDWVRYRLFRHPTEDRIAPEHMVLNQYNVITSGELTQDRGLEQVVVTTLDRSRLTLIPTHLFASSVYKVLDGSVVWTPDHWTFDKASQVLTLQQDMLTGEVREFSGENVPVTVYFIPGTPVTSTYLQNHPLLDGITNLNEGTPPVPMSQVGNAQRQVIDGVVHFQDEAGTLYEHLDFMTVDNGGETGLLSAICEGGPGTGFSGLSTLEGEAVYSPNGAGDPLGGVGGVAGHFETGDTVGAPVGAEVFDFSGTAFWQDCSFPAKPAWTQKGGSSGGILFASGGSFVNPVVDGAGNIVPGVLVAGGGNLGPGTAVLWPSYPSRGPVGGDQGRIYKRTDWFLRWGPGAGAGAGLLLETLTAVASDSTLPLSPPGWEPNPNGPVYALGGAQALMQYAGDYSRVGPWGGLAALTPDRDYGTFRIVAPADGDVVRVWDPVPAVWVSFTAKLVPVAPTDFAMAPNPHTALADALNAYTFSVALVASAGLTLSGQTMVRVESEVPAFSDPLYIQTMNPTGFAIADVVRLPNNIGMLTNGAGVQQSSLLAGGTRLGLITEVPNTVLGMVAQGGSALPLGARVNLTLHT